MKLPPCNFANIICFKTISRGQASTAQKSENPFYWVRALQVFHMFPIPGRVGFCPSGKKKKTKKFFFRSGLFFLLQNETSVLFSKCGLEIESCVGQQYCGCSLIFNGGPILQIFQYFV